jgi:hypothetical protein
MYRPQEFEPASASNKTPTLKQSDVAALKSTVALLERGANDNTTVRWVRKISHADDGAVRKILREEK